MSRTASRGEPSSHPRVRGCGPIGLWSFPRWGSGHADLPPGGALHRLRSQLAPTGAPPLHEALDGDRQAHQPILDRDVPLPPVPAAPPPMIAHQVRQRTCHARLLPPPLGIARRLASRRAASYAA
jgi:hypothetical protein